MISEREIIKQAEQKLFELLKNMPMPVEPSASHEAINDLRMNVKESGRRWTLLCEVRRTAQPRTIREAAYVIRDRVQHMDGPGHVYPVVVAPFISPASGQICSDLGVGFADLAGNCRLAFGAVYIEKSVAKNPFSVKRDVRSLYAPKSARVLRIMLEHPKREWKITELASRANISIGQVSKVRKHLLDREWASGKWGGVRLSKPRSLLDEWRKAYAPLRGSRGHYYTLLHGEELQRAIKETFRFLLTEKPGPQEQNVHLVLNSFSAARWLAPYMRIAGEFFYADAVGQDVLTKRLHLEPAAKGANILIDIASDAGVFQENAEPIPGLHATGPIQTYLDLASAGERGVEAAEHLFNERIAHTWRDGE